MNKNSWPAVIVAAGFLALIGLILVVTLPRGAESPDSFLKVWAGVGSLVGVAVGAIPAYFFKQQADAARQDATEARMALGTTRTPPAP